MFDQEFGPTLSYCRSGADGSIGASNDETFELELRGAFETGLTVADRYLLQERLGQGAMGRVFRAQDLRLGRDVAMKVVAHRRRGIDLEKVLEREAKLGASLNHRGIAAVYDFGFHDNKSFTVFEFVEGETLRLLLHHRGRFSLRETARIIGDLAAAMDFAHVKGIVHRDLKPENICFTPTGDFKILDFGIAQDVNSDVEQGIYSGTPAYSSPEQSRCRPTDGRSDQYALALIAFEMLSGQKAFVDKNVERLLAKQVNSPPPRLRDFVPELPDHVEAAILQALNKAPDDRYGTCQEFARELSGGAMTPTIRPFVVASTRNQIGFFVSHVADETLLARQLGEGLERRGYSTWFYGRDAMPGVSLSGQSKEAIDSAQAMILLVSRPSVRSADFEREIGHAHHVGCPMLPILVDLSREEFERGAPSWRATLGGASLIEHRRGDPLEFVLDRLVSSAEVLGIESDEAEASRTRIVTSPCSGPIWATDANQIDILDLDRVLFRNDTIDDFLNRRHRYFVSATKGFGKTLLLTCKRRLLRTTSESPITMVPEGRPYLDFMSEMRSLSARYEQPLSELTTTKRLWSAALRISAISHNPKVIDNSDIEETGLFPARFQRWLQGTRVQPTVVFKELTSLRVSELNRLIDQSENFLDQKMRQIHGATCFFIDKVDQAIHHLHRDAWINIQAGLIEAAWEMMNANSHLKVFASIRQEAFTNYQSDIKSNLFAATTSLNYTDEELQALLDQLANCYEGQRSFADFLGHNVVRHGRRPAPEDSFQYVRRHTCGRPRDLVAIASEISSRRSAMNEKRLREIVQQTGSTVLVSNIFDEVRVFLNCLDDREDRLRFLLDLSANVLDKADAIRVCEVFNGLEPGTLQHFGEDSTEIYHPFQDLYFSGLLGVVTRDPEDGTMIQRFRKPHDSLIHSATELPESPFFLIHPALDTFIRAQ
ncbi:MAG: protein kinase, partial [Planctomycetaceae bacterium]|nr:protein kinase [Planctomycetaceae bacterium]